MSTIKTWISGGTRLFLSKVALSESTRSLLNCSSGDRSRDKGLSITWWEFEEIVLVVCIVDVLWEEFVWKNSVGLEIRDQRCTKIEILIFFRRERERESIFMVWFVFDIFKEVCWFDNFTFEFLLRYRV